MNEPVVMTKVIGNGVYEIIPTQRGYAYVISIGLSIILVVLYGHFNSLGMLFNDFMIDIGAGVGGLTFALGINNTCMSFSGILTNVALKKFSLRQVGLCGAILYSFGWLLTGFIQSMNQMMITFGLMMGVGCGILFTIAFASFNEYFLAERRVMILSTVQFFTCSFGMVYPFVIEKFLTEYGYRGTILIIAGILFHSFLAVISFHPVEWHSKKKLLYQTVNENDVTGDFGIDENIKLKTKFTVERVDDGNIEHGQTAAKNKIAGKLQVITQLFDLSLLKDIVFLNLMIGLTTGLMADISFFTIFPGFLYDVGFDMSQVAKSLSILGGSDLVGRAFLVIFLKFYKVRGELIFYFGILLTTLTRIVFFFCTTYTTLSIITGILGFLRALIQSPYAAVYAEYAHERFSAAMGWGMLFYGTLSMPLMTVLGSLYGKTNSHFSGFVLLTFFNLICIVPWTIKLWYFRRLDNNRI
ncbi:monocarboxylate transporter 7-like [Arctopsyche grandis]|uniref:monocarboxylate transporter 7-like n=1 Tax=Arctopsyche grandis TaxID=121162 RepID=UPI00406D8DC4